MLNASLANGSNLSFARFLGGVLDTAAVKYCVGIAQEEAFYNYYGIPYKLSPSTSRFRFGDITSTLFGTLTIPLQNPKGVLELDVHVVPQQVRLRLGADILDAQRRYVKRDV